MNAYITGAKGYMGQAFVRAGCHALDADITNLDAIEVILAKAKPDIVIHLAGISDPDKCEKDFDLAFKINVMGTLNVVGECARLKTPVVILSSSQIWGGGWWEHLWNRHSEVSKHTPAINSYGMQKVAAENWARDFNYDGYMGAKIVRTSRVFNRARLTRELDYLKAGVSIDAPTFIKRSFIHLNDFVYLVSNYCTRFNSMPPILHLAGSQTVSFYDFWLEVCKQFGYDPKLVKPRKKEKDFLFAAKRPHYGGLDVSLSQRLGFPSFDYVGGIKRMLTE